MQMPTFDLQMPKVVDGCIIALDSTKDERAFCNSLETKDLSLSRPYNYVMPPLFITLFLLYILLLYIRRSILYLYPFVCITVDAFQNIARDNC